MQTRAIKLWFYSSLIWLAIGPAIGLFQSLQFLWPDSLNFMSALALPFSKMRILHTNLAIYGWVVMMLIGAALYIVPRLCKVELKNPGVAYWAGWLWNVALGLNVVLIWAGVVGNPWLSIQAAEYAEAPLICDLLITVSVVMLIFSVHHTVLKREQARLYVSVWYLLGGLYTAAMTYLAGNFLVLGFSGLGYQVIESWWLHNAVGFIVTPLGLGVAYYLIPIAAQRPLHSHSLSILGFWTLMAFYPGTGLHHFLQMPMPAWIHEFAVISSVLLAIPVLAVVSNHFLTPRGNWRRAIDSYPLRFAILGSAYYLLTCIQGPFQATAAVNWFIHFTEWVQAHAHLALTGAFTCYGMAAALFLYPRVTGKQLYSRSVANWTFWLMAVIFPLYYLGFTHAGLVTAISINLLGNTIYETLDAVWLSRFFRTVTGGGVVLAFLLFGWLFIRSKKHGKPFEEGMNETPDAPQPVKLEEAPA